MQSATAATGDLPAPAAEFSVRDYARTAHGSHRDALDLAHFRADPLDAPTLEIVDYLARLERGALRYLRSVLVTPTHKDARVTAFLVTWAYEKYWIADALEQIVLVHGRQPSDAVSQASPLVRFGRAVAERFEPVRESIVANVIGEDVVAVHTATGAIDDWILGATYDRLVERTTDDELARTLRMLRKVKERHAEFFAAQTRDRLARSPKATALARRRLRRVAWPLGADDAPANLAARLFLDVLRREDAEEIDRRVAARLGSDLQLVRKAAVRAAAAARREEAHR